MADGGHLNGRPVAIGRMDARRRSRHCSAGFFGFRNNSSMTIYRAWQEDRKKKLEEAKKVEVSLP